MEILEPMVLLQSTFSLQNKGKFLCLNVKFKTVHKESILILAFIHFYACVEQGLVHPEGTSIGSDNCDFLKVSDFNESL